MIKNNLKIILADRDMSIKELAEKTDIRYGTLFAFVKKRELKIKGKQENELKHNDTKEKTKRYRPESVNLEIIDKVCKVLSIGPGDFLFYKPDKE